MSVIANINPASVAVSGNFIPISDGYQKYAQDLAFTFATGAKAGGSDHFISMFNDIDRITKEYAANASRLPDIMAEIQNTPNLYKWFSAVICSFIYGFDGQNNLHIEGLPFETLNGNSIIPIPNSEYLKIWKEKFDLVGGSNTNEEDISSGYKDVHSLNIVSFGDGGYPDVIGCFSNRYFIIPLQELKLSTYNVVNKWKEKYNFLCDNHEELTDVINGLNIRQKVLLKLSAMSIAPNAPEPLKLIQAIIDKYVDTNGVNIINGTIPDYKTLGGIKFYKTIAVIDLDDLISDTLYLGIHKQNGNSFYCATYPITDAMITGLKNGGTIEKLRLNVTPAGGNNNAVLGATVSFDYKSDLVFVASPGVVTNVSPVLTYIYPVSKVYDLNHIKNITKLQTVCMYPNLPAAYEERCSKYTYFSCDGSTIMLGSIFGMSESIDLSNGIFKGAVDNSGVKNVIIRKDMPRQPNDNMYKATKTPNGTVYTTTATVPEHFVEVCDSHGNECGYALNIRTMTDDVPALLIDNAVPVDISLPSQIGASNNDLYAFVDFGSSSSCMKYRIGKQGSLIDTTVKNNCTVRTFLAEYLKGDYKLIINDPTENTHTKFMSISTVYDEVLGVNDYSIYKDAWMPVTKNLSGYEPDIKVSTSHKTELVDRTSVVSPNIIINNLCYMIACNAVSLNCNEAYVIPSLPSSDYKDSLDFIWNSAIADMRNMFPNLKIHNVLNTPDLQFLFESIAISNGIPFLPPNNLQINIDMGDGTTDMSAIIIDGNGEISMCGYSSIEYAGKNLIKTTIRDILEHSPEKTAENMFKGAMGPSLFTPFDSTPAGKSEYEGKVDNLIHDFFQNGQLVHQNDDAWENKVMDVLSISNMKANIDQKVAANFILRYMLLMPVVKDFIHTAIKIAGNKFEAGITTITIQFIGGSAKGIELLNVIDLRTVKAGHILEKYFKNEFGASTNIIGISHVPNAKDGKNVLIDGLGSLDVTIDPVKGEYNLKTAIPIDVIDWNDVNPQSLADFGEDNSVHKNVLSKPFVSVADSGGNTIKAANSNKKIITSTVSYYKNPSNPFDEFKEYFNDEIYGKLIDNHDGNPDTIEMLIKDFLNNASSNMKSAVMSELLNAAAGNSFYLATHSSIYPEMMKSAIYMFAISKLLSQFQGKFTDTIIKQLRNDTADYAFGG